MRVIKVLIYDDGEVVRSVVEETNPEWHLRGNFNGFDSRASFIGVRETEDKIDRAFVSLLNQQVKETERGLRFFRRKG